MVYELIFFPDVMEDVAEAYNWYEDRQEGLGDRFLAEQVVFYEKLEKNPQLYRKTNNDYRKVDLINFPYRLGFEIVDQRVVVFGFFRTRRNPNEMVAEIGD